MRVSQLIVILIAILGSNFYVFYRLWHLMPATLWGRVILIVFATVVISAPFIAFLLGERLSYGVASALNKIGTSWLIAYLYLLIIFIIADLTRITHLFSIDKFLYGNWLSLGVLVVAVGSLLTYGYVKYRDKARVELDLSINKVMSTPKPIKIVAISDLHLGFNIGNKELGKWIELINSEQPDVVIIGGDIVDNIIRPLYDKNMVQTLHELKSKFGVFAVLGNHEYIGGVNKSMQFMRDAGIVPLRDSVILVDDLFYIVGRDDRTNAGRRSLAELTSTIDHSKPIIMMDHQPYNLEESAENGIDFQFSGHTHKGQVWPVSVITGTLFEKSHGYLKKADSHYYISSGLGIWGGKFRIGTRSEYIVINLGQ